VKPPRCELIWFVRRMIPFPAAMRPGVRLLRFSGSFFGLAMRFLGRLKRLVGVFHGLFGMLVAGLMVLFAVMNSGCAVSVRSLLVKFSSALVGVVWHNMRPGTA
jgi:hypothetical protein